ncbi:hypothetical protein J6590_061405 [Homalodisca vitripennis]|nr:hypothetical protein J6590_061405 [Homalodisca vitripennis]
MIGLLARTRSLSGHPSKQQPRLTLFDPVSMYSRTMQVKLLSSRSMGESIQFKVDDLIKEVTVTDRPELSPTQTQNPDNISDYDNISDPDNISDYDTISDPENISDYAISDSDNISDYNTISDPDNISDYTLSDSDNISDYDTISDPDNISDSDTISEICSLNKTKNTLKCHSRAGKVRAKKTSLTQPGDQRLKGDFRTTTNGRAGGLHARLGSLSSHSFKQQPRSTLLDLRLVFVRGDKAFIWRYSSFLCSDNVWVRFSSLDFRLLMYQSDFSSSCCNWAIYSPIGYRTYRGERVKSARTT